MENLFLLSFPESYDTIRFFQAAAWQKYFAEFLQGLEKVKRRMPRPSWEPRFLPC